MSGRRADVDRRATAIRIVQRQNACLGDRVGGTERERVQRVALDLDRSAVVTAHEYASRHAGHFQNRGIELGDARLEAFGFVGERMKLLFGPPPTAGHGQSRQRQRRAHELKEFAPGRLTESLRVVIGELALEFLAQLRRLRHMQQAAPIRRPIGGQVGLTDFVG